MTPPALCPYCLPPQLGRPCVPVGVPFSASPPSASLLLQRCHPFLKARYGMLEVPKTAAIIQLVQVLYNSIAVSSNIQCPRRRSLAAGMPRCGRTIHAHSHAQHRTRTNTFEWHFNHNEKLLRADTHGELNARIPLSPYRPTLFTLPLPFRPSLRKSRQQQRLTTARLLAKQRRPVQRLERLVVQVVEERVTQRLGG